MAPPTDEAPHGDAPDPTTSGGSLALGWTEVLVLEAEAPHGVIPGLEGMDLRRVHSVLALRAALRAFQRGVIAVVMPPAAREDLELVAGAAMGRPAIRTLLVNDPADIAGRLRALELGFDEALPSTVGRDELRGRITLLAVRTRLESQDRLPIGVGVELDLTARALRRSGRLVRLRPMEFRLLEELARNPGRPLTRDRLMRQVWGADDHSASRTVDVHMRWLRAKVERDPERPEHLLTVRGVGYQLELGPEAAVRLRSPAGPLTGR